MANDLSFQLRANEILWQRWLEFGITPGDKFEIKFHFSTVREDAANALITGLEKTGVVARKEARRTLFVLKDWFITVPISQSWTLESLNN